MKARYNGILYKVIDKTDKFVILEGKGGYTFKAYLENVIFENKPEEVLPKERPPVNDIVEQSEDKSLIEMPYVDTPDHRGFDFAFEILNKNYPDINERKQVFITMLKDIFDGKKVQSPRNEDNIIELKTDEDKQDFSDYLLSDDTFKLSIQKFFNLSIEDIMDTISRPTLINEIDLKKIATHPDVIDAIKTVYSIKGVGDRKGEYSPERAVGMLKRAAELLKKEGKLTEEEYIKRIVEWLKKSGDRGKGRKVIGLNDLPGEVMSDISKQPKKEPETKLNDNTKELVQKIIDYIENGKVTYDEINTVLKDENALEYLDQIITVLEKLNVEIVDEKTPETQTPAMSGELNECGVTSAAAPGTMDATTNQAIDGTSGIAIRPSRFGKKDEYKSDLQRRLAEEVGYASLEEVFKTEVPTTGLTSIEVLKKKQNDEKQKEELKKYYSELENNKQTPEELEEVVKTKLRKRQDATSISSLKGPYEHATKVLKDKEQQNTPKEKELDEVVSTNLRPTQNLRDITTLKGPHADAVKAQGTATTRRMPAITPSVSKTDDTKKYTKPKSHSVGIMREKIKKLFDNINNSDNFEFDIEEQEETTLEEEFDLNKIIDESLNS